MKQALAQVPLDADSSAALRVPHALLQWAMACVIGRARARIDAQQAMSDARAALSPGQRPDLRPPGCIDLASTLPPAQA